MHAQILVPEEMEDLAARVTDAVLAVVVDRAAQLTDPGMRSAVAAVVVAARDQLAHAPVDPEPLVRAILHGEPVAHLPADEVDTFAVTSTAIPVAGPVPVDAPGAPGADAPSYWPAVPAISDELFAEYAANSLKAPNGDPSGSCVSPQHADQEHADEADAMHGDEADADDSPTAGTESAADPGLDPITAEGSEPELNQVHGGRFHARPLRRQKKSRR